MLRTVLDTVDLPFSLSHGTGLPVLVLSLIELHQSCQPVGKLVGQSAL